MRIVAAALLLLAAPAWAQTPAAPAPAARPALDPERLAAAKSLMEALEIEKQMRQTVAPMMDRVMREAMRAATANDPAFEAELARDPKKKAQWDRATTVITTEFGGLMREVTPQMLDMTTEVYARVYTLDEMRAIRRFYLTPEGRSMLAKTPQVMEETMAVMSRTVFPAMQQRLPAIVAKVTAELGPDQR